MSDGAPSRAPRRLVAVCGSSAPRPGEEAYAQAMELGRRLADAGFDLINGGHQGVMEASARGAREGGAHVIGVTCGAIRASRGAVVNAYVTELIDAPSLLARLEVLMRRAGGYVFLEGATGTLAELGVFWEHLHSRLIAPRPLVCLGPAWVPLIVAVAQEQPSAAACVTIAADVDGAVRVLAAQAIDVGPAERA